MGASFGNWSRSRASRLHGDERALTSVLFAVGLMPFFLAMLAIVTDVGFVMATRSDLQRSADAAARAGALHVLEDPALARTEAQGNAQINYATLVTNSASIDGVRVTVALQANAQSLFSPESWLSFGEPLVRAAATARVASARLPGPGVFCVGVSLTAQQSAEIVQLTQGSPLSQTWADLDPFITILRAGASSGSNAGFIDIEGPVNENTRDCLRDGSANPVEPVEETQPGLSTGQAAQALQDRLQAAQARNCFDWADVVASIQEADPDGDGVADAGAWRCDPLTNQATAVVLVPIVNEDFQSQQGTSQITLHDLGPTSTYQFGLYWIDPQRTFEDLNANKWKFDTPNGQGHAELKGVFLLDRPMVITTATSNPDGGVVDCDPSAAGYCFVQLVD
ncbi:MAG: Flp pilus assembly protein TadG [Chloroflexi bacterium]|jgi:hypothetical protein|nr:MAG: Flp pilus assembly protein TadG [Chloroflexota bacterium]